MPCHSHSPRIATNSLQNVHESISRNSTWTQCRLGHCSCDSPSGDSLQLSTPEHPVVTSFSKGQVQIVSSSPFIQATSLPLSTVSLTPRSPQIMFSPGVTSVLPITLTDMKSTATLVQCSSQPSPTMKVPADLSVRVSDTHTLSSLSVPSVIHSDQLTHTITSFHSSLASTVAVTTSGMSLPGTMSASSGVCVAKKSSPSLPSWTHITSSSIKKYLPKDFPFPPTTAISSTVSNFVSYTGRLQCAPPPGRLQCAPPPEILQCISPPVKQVVSSVRKFMPSVSTEKNLSRICAPPLCSASLSPSQIDSTFSNQSVIALTPKHSTAKLPLPRLTSMSKSPVFVPKPIYQQAAKVLSPWQENLNTQSTAVVDSSKMSESRSAYLPSTPCGRISKGVTPFPSSSSSVVQQSLKSLMLPAITSNNIMLKNLIPTSRRGSDSTSPLQQPPSASWIPLSARKGKVVARRRFSASECLSNITTSSHLVMRRVRSCSGPNTKAISSDYISHLQQVLPSHATGKPSLSSSEQTSTPNMLQDGTAEWHGVPQCKSSMCSFEQSRASVSQVPSVTLSNHGNVIRKTSEQCRPSCTKQNLSSGHVSQGQVQPSYTKQDFSSVHVSQGQVRPSCTKQDFSSVHVSQGQVRPSYTKQDFSSGQVSQGQVQPSYTKLDFSSGHVSQGQVQPSYTKQDFSSGQISQGQVRPSYTKQDFSSGHVSQGQVQPSYTKQDFSSGHVSQGQVRPSTKQDFSSGHVSQRQVRPSTKQDFSSGQVSQGQVRPSYTKQDFSSGHVSQGQVRPSYTKQDFSSGYVSQGQVRPSYTKQDFSSGYVSQGQVRPSYTKQDFTSGHVSQGQVQPSYTKQDFSSGHVSQGQVKPSYTKQDFSSGHVSRGQVQSQSTASEQISAAQSGSTTVRRFCEQCWPSQGNGSMAKLKSEEEGHSAPPPPFKPFAGRNDEHVKKATGAVMTRETSEQLWHVHAMNNSMCVDKPEGKQPSLLRQAADYGGGSNSSESGISTMSRRGEQQCLLSQAKENAEPKPTSLQSQTSVSDPEYASSSPVQTHSSAPMCGSNLMTRRVCDNFWCSRATSPASPRLELAAGCSGNNMPMCQKCWPSCSKRNFTDENQSANKYRTAVGTEMRHSGLEVKQNSVVMVPPVHQGAQRHAIHPTILKQSASSVPQHEHAAVQVDVLARTNPPGGSWASNTLTNQRNRDVAESASHERSGTAHSVVSSWSVCDGVSGNLVCSQQQKRPMLSLQCYNNNGSKSSTTCKKPSSSTGSGHMSHVNVDKPQPLTSMMHPSPHSQHATHSTHQFKPQPQQLLAPQAPGPSGHWSGSPVNREISTASERVSEIKPVGVSMEVIQQIPDDTLSQPSTTMGAMQGVVLPNAANATMATKQKTSTQNMLSMSIKESSTPISRSFANNIGCVVKAEQGECLSRFTTPYARIRTPACPVTHPVGIGGGLLHSKPTPISVPSSVIQQHYHLGSSYLNKVEHNLEHSFASSVFTADRSNDVSNQGNRERLFSQAGVENVNSNSVHVQNPREQRRERPCNLSVNGLQGSDNLIKQGAEYLSPSQNRQQLSSNTSVNGGSFYLQNKGSINSTPGKDAGQASEMKCSVQYYNPQPRVLLNSSKPQSPQPSLLRCSNEPQPSLLQCSNESQPLLLRCSNEPQPPVLRSSNEPQPPLLQCSVVSQPSVLQCSNEPQPPVLRCSNEPQPPVIQCSKESQSPMLQCSDESQPSVLWCSNISQPPVLQCSNEPQSPGLPCSNKSQPSVLWCSNEPQPPMLECSNKSQPSVLRCSNEPQPPMLECSNKSQSSVLRCSNNLQSLVMHLSGKPQNYGMQNIASPMVQNSSIISGHQASLVPHSMSSCTDDSLKQFLESTTLGGDTPIINDLTPTTSEQLQKILDSAQEFIRLEELRQMGHASSLSGASNALPVTSPQSGASNALPVTSPHSGASNALPVTSPQSGASNALPVTSPHSGASNALPVTSLQSGASNALPVTSLQCDNTLHAVFRKSKGINNASLSPLSLRSENKAGVLVTPCCRDTDQNQSELQSLQPRLHSIPSANFWPSTVLSGNYTKLNVGSASISPCATSCSLSSNAQRPQVQQIFNSNTPKSKQLSPTRKTAVVTPYRREVAPLTQQNSLASLGQQNSSPSLTPPYSSSTFAQHSASSSFTSQYFSASPTPTSPMFSQHLTSPSLSVQSFSTSLTPPCTSPVFSWQSISPSLAQQSFSSSPTPPATSPVFPRLLVSPSLTPQLFSASHTSPGTSPVLSRHSLSPCLTQHSTSSTLSQQTNFPVLSPQSISPAFPWEVASRGQIPVVLRSTHSPVGTTTHSNYQTTPLVKLAQVDENSISICPCSLPSPSVRSMLSSESDLYMKQSPQTEHNLVVLDQSSTNGQGVGHTALQTIPVTSQALAVENGHRSYSISGMEHNFIESGTVRGHISGRVLSRRSSKDGGMDVSLSASSTSVEVYGHMMGEAWEPATTTQSQHKREVNSYY